MKKNYTRMDFLIFAAVIALIAGFFVKAWTLRQNASENVPFTYHMELVEPTPGITDAMNIGDVVYCEDGKAIVGTICDIEIGDDHIVITLTAEGTPIEGGCRVGFYDITPGLYHSFFTKYAYWSGIVTKLQ